MKKWIDSVRNTCNDEQLKEICYGIIMYGLYGIKIDTADPTVKISLSFVLPQIDNMNKSYEKKADVGSSVGRKKQVDDMAVYKLAREGKTGLEIAALLGLSKTVVYDSPGWKNRKNGDAF